MHRASFLDYSRLIWRYGRNNLGQIIDEVSMVGKSIEKLDITTHSKANEDRFQKESC